MATLALKPLELVKIPSGGAAEYEKRTLTTGTPIAGDLGVLTNNEITLCGADPTVISYFIQASGDSTIPGETSKLQVVRIHPDYEFEISIYHSTPASAVLAAADIDGQVEYGIIKATVSGVTAWCLDLEETTTKSVRIVQAVGSFADLYQRVRVQFLSSRLTFAN